MTQDRLRIRGLTTKFPGDHGSVTAVSDLDLTVERDAVVGILGPSGAGKTVLAHSILDLVDPPGQVTNGRLWFHAPELADRFRTDRPRAATGEFVDLRQLPARTQRQLRHTTIRITLEDASNAFPPTVPAGTELKRALAINRPPDARPDWLVPAEHSLGERLRAMPIPWRSPAKRDRHDRALKLLSRFGIDDPAQALEEHPHELPDGVLRRIHLAEAVATGPELLIADEPTAGLTAATQQRVLAALEAIRAETGMSMLLLSHDPTVITSLSDRVGVLYHGELVEEGSVAEVFEDPRHPSTRTILADAE